MRRALASLFAPCAMLVLAGCVAASAEQAPRAVQAAPTYSVAGLEGVMGQTVGVLQSLFGRPELDVHEGDARKLQFVGPVCVLDAYLYPSRQGGEGVVSWIDARLPDGRDIDRASCVAALRAKQQVR